MKVLGLRVLAADDESVDYGTSDIFFSIDSSRPPGSLAWQWSAHCV
jgi:hypothetical protein